MRVRWRGSDLVFAGNVEKFVMDVLAVCLVFERAALKWGVFWCHLQFCAWGPLSRDQIDLDPTR